MKRRWFGIGFAVGMIVTLVWFSYGVGVRMPVSQWLGRDMTAPREIFLDAVEIAQYEYVEPVDLQEMVYAGINGMIRSLDRHSQFLDPDEFEEMRVDASGQFGGLGIEIGIQDGMLTIIRPMEETPAQAAGLLPGDRIVRIGEFFTRGISLHEAVQRLRGEPETQVTLTILRDANANFFDVTLTRAVIKIWGVEESRFAKDKIAYVRISDFQENTPQDLRQALERLKVHGMEGLILDLRRNPGGLLEVAVDVASLFLKPGLEVVSTRGRREDQNLNFVSEAEYPYLGFPMAVLVDGGSASASEIVAGALQDHNRATLLGTQTYGKGSVQTVIPLKDGSALRLTTSRYFTPAGRGISDQGILPDMITEDISRKKGKAAQMILGSSNDPTLIQAVKLLKAL